jgi:hypothetical protein
MKRFPHLGLVVPSFLLLALPAVAGERIWSSAAVPAVIEEEDPNAVELGVKFCARISGTLNAIHFYKGPRNTGPHTARLWFPTGTPGNFVLAAQQEVSTSATGWITVPFADPVHINEGNTYLASYHTPSGYYSVDENYFYPGAAASTWLRTFLDGVEGGNGVYRYGPLTHTAPSDSFRSSNYWVDVDFTPGPLFNHTLLEPCSRPETRVADDTSAVELGIRFTPHVAGTLRGVRFFRGATTPWINYPIHLWKDDGTLLASGVIPVSQNPNNGWVVGYFSTPVTVTPGEVYVASYHAPNGGYSYTLGEMASGIWSQGGQLHSLPDGGVFAYGPSGSFPSQTLASTNYYVDVVFAPTP